MFAITDDGIIGELERLFLRFRYTFCLQKLWNISEIVYRGYVLHLITKHS